MGPFLLFYSALLILDVLWDWYRIKYKKRQLKHDLETVAAALFYTIGTVLLVFYLSKGSIDERRDLVIYSIGLLLLWAPVRWIWHDLLLNIIRDLPFDYLGREAQSAESDRLLVRLAERGLNQFAVKLFALFIGLVLNLFANLVIYLI